MQVRSANDDGPWTMTEYGDRLFSMGGNLYGPKSQIFKLAVTASCLDVLAQDISKTPFRLHKKTANGSEVDKDHPLNELLDFGPNPIMTMPEFIGALVMNLALDSEYFVPVRRNNRGDVTEFSGVPKSNVSCSVNPTARKWFYDIRPSTMHEQALFGWAEGRLSHEQCVHMRRRSLNGLDVMSTLSLSGQAVGLLRKMNEFQDSTFANGGVPKVAFTFPDELTDKQFARVKEGVAASLKKSQRDGTPIVLEGSDGEVPKVEKLSMSTTDTDFIKSNINAAMDVIRYFRVPPHKVYLMESIKYDNMDSVERVYVDDTLCPYFLDIQQALARVLLTQEERSTHFFQFDIEAAYALNPAERQKIVEGRWKSGQITFDEMRVRIGENPVGGEQGQMRMVAGAFAMINAKGEVVSKSTASDPKKPADEQDPEDDKNSKRLRVVN